MNKKIKNLVLVLSVVSAIGIVIKLQGMPDRIPVHWNFAGEVDGYGSKFTYLLFGFLPLIMILLFDFMPKIDPRKDNYKYHSKAYSITIICTAILFIVLPWGILYMMDHQNISVMMIVSIPLGLLFLVLGNYMPTFRPTYFVGIRTPWTLADDDVWRKTHRIGGYVFMAIGALIMLGGFVKVEIFQYIFLISVLGGVAFLYVYSYLVYKNKDNDK